MKNTLINKLNLENRNNFLAVVSSKCGIGKTTLLTILASEYLNDNKNVLFLTNETSQSLIKDKIKNDNSVLIIEYYEQLDEILYN